jgi:Lysyl oxidase
MTTARTTAHCPVRRPRGYFANRRLLFRSISQRLPTMVPRMRTLHVLVVVTLAATAGPAYGQSLPDIEPRPPFEVGVVERAGRWYLGFATEARNIGPGALRIRGTGSGSGTMTAAQLTEDGTGVLNDHVGTLQYVATVTHNHWHLLDFMRYELQGVDHPTVVRDQKQGFCLAGDPAAPFVTGWCAPNQPTLTSTEVGLMPGGREVYAPYVEGQEIMIDPTTAPAGRYLLNARIGPTGLLKETRSDNNVASTLIELKWAAGDSQPQLRPVDPADDRCIGAGCTGTLPAASKRAARRLARKALRGTLGVALPSRRIHLTCKVKRDRVHVCRVRVRHGRLSFSGSVRIWYVVRPTGTKWYYTIKGTRRTVGCGSSCNRRIRRVGRLGGTVAVIARTRPTARPSATSTSFVCAVARDEPWAMLPGRA